MPCSQSGTHHNSHCHNSSSATGAVFCLKPSLSKADNANRISCARRSSSVSHICREGCGSGFGASALSNLADRLPASTSLSRKAQECLFSKSSSQDQRTASRFTPVGSSIYHRFVCCKMFQLCSRTISIISCHLSGMLVSLVISTNIFIMPHVWSSNETNALSVQICV